MRPIVRIAPLLLLAACAPARVKTRMMMDEDKPPAVIQPGRQVPIPSEPPPAKQGMAVDEDRRAAVPSPDQRRPLPEEPKPPAG